MPDIILYSDMDHFKKYKYFRKSDQEAASAIMAKARKIVYAELDKL
jgi:predicted class III extradiol MEMO1 family dioxygenase